MLITASNLTLSFGAQTILDTISFSVRKNEKIGIVGRNGVGKTTLFSLISGQLLPTSGTLRLSSQIKIGLLSQMPLLNMEQNAYDNLLSVFQSLQDMELQLQNMQQKISASAHSETEDSPLLNNYARLAETYENQGGYSYHSRIRGMLSGFGFSQKDLDRPVHTFSAGQQNKIAFAKLLLEEPDLLLLDEPTNFFDIASMTWLENYLKNYIGTVLIISHDRYFLDNIVEKIFEIENHQLHIYHGDYTTYTKLKAQRQTLHQTQYQQQQKEIARQEEIIARFRRYNREKSIKQAESRQKALDKMQLLPKPNTSARHIHISFPAPSRSGKVVLEMMDLSKSFGSRSIIKHFFHTVYRGQKTGIFGANGIGKSTLLRIIGGIDHDFTGEIKHGYHVQSAFYEQAFSFQHETVLDEILFLENHAFTVDEARSYLAKFLFTADDIYKNISVLSGGEKSRLSLLKLLLQKANLLLLDEPTNHLDISSMNALEEALADYSGTVIMVSHDRYFLNNVCDSLLVFENGTLNAYDGNYAYYLQRKAEESLSTENNISFPAKKDKKTHVSQDTSLKKTRKELRSLEEEIHHLETTVQQLEEQMCQPDFYQSELHRQVLAEYTVTKEKLTQCENNWLMLAETIDSDS